MRLILMRHGKAEPSRPDLPDEVRRLIAEGRRDLNDHLPSLARYLTCTDKLKIWTSPYKRARETADILCRYLPGAKVKEKTFIATGDTEALYKALAKVSPRTTVLLIGHEPFLSDWVELMAKRRTRFKKGAIEFLLLDPARPEEAVRMGAMELHEMASLEPLDMPLTVGMKEILLANHKAILALKDRLTDDIEDDDILHRLRIAIRSQKAYLGILEDFADPKAYRKAQKAYSRLLRELGHLRELDVLLETIHNAKRWELAPVVNHIMAERNDEAMRLDMHFSDPANEEDYNEAYYKALIALSTVDEDMILSQAIDRIMLHNFRALQKEAAQLIDSDDYKALHRFRVHCKHHRYRYERFASIAGYGVARRYALIRSLAGTLGAYGDTFYNTDVLRDIVADTTDSKELVALDIYARLQLASREKYDHALRQQMRQLMHLS